MPEIRLTRRARDDLQALPDAVRDAVIETLTVLAVDPKSIGKCRLGRLEGLWSARIGSYRILYTIESRGVIVRAIRHRAVAYRRRRTG